MKWNVNKAIIIGNDHLMTKTNKQDFCSVVEVQDKDVEEHKIVGVVCDGCSSGKHSEVGATLIGTYLMNSLLTTQDIDSLGEDTLKYQLGFGLTSFNQKPDLFTEVYKDKPIAAHALTKAINEGEISPVIDPIKSIDYVAELLTKANKPLCIWPYHTELGTPGQALDPALYEILMFQTLARKAQLNFLQKGQIPQTEMYGILSPEVQIKKHKQGGFNTDFLNLLMKNDKVIVAGQAKYHCVLESLKQIYNFFKNESNASEIFGKIYILQDCMSSVKHPTIDFEAIGAAEFDKFRNEGFNIIDSTELDLAV